MLVASRGEHGWSLEQSRVEMGDPLTENPAEVVAVEESAAAWPSVFKDVANGNDIVRWHAKFIQEMAPVALFGQDLGNGVVFVPVIDDGERTTLSFPCFLDSDPLPTKQYSGPGTKVKFNGKWSEGAILVTDRGLVVISDYGNIFGAVYVSRDRLRELNELQFKFSLLSMTSVGPGYELMLYEPDGSTDRILFRVALTPVSKDGFDSTLRTALFPHRQ